MLFRKREPSPKIIFLHLPKTAGQSVRKMLDEAYAGQAISPARSNEDLLTYSIQQLNQFQVIAPHGDWTLLEAVEKPRYVFSVFREPQARLLSYYFYVLNKAKDMPESERKLPHHQGLNHVFTKTPDEYFFPDVPHLKAFIDDIYDNFYTYYFAGRTLDARRRLKNLINRNMISEDQILDNAIANIKRLDGIFTIDQLALVKIKIEQLSGKSLNNDYNENINHQEKPEVRIHKLQELGASHKVIDYLESCSNLDKKLYQIIQEECIK